MWKRLLEDVSGVAYDKAVEVVTDKVREQTQLEDMEVIEKYRKSVVSPNAKNSPEVVKIANTLLSRVREKLQQSAEKDSQKGAGCAAKTGGQAGWQRAD